MDRDDVAKLALTGTVLVALVGLAVLAAFVPALQGVLTQVNASLLGLLGIHHGHDLVQQRLGSSPVAAAAPTPVVTAETPQYALPQLSAHFTLDELTATSHPGFDQTPSPDVVHQLRNLCTNFLEPMRARFGPLQVTSGYRCQGLNTAVGGVGDSAHVFGCAADVQALDPAVTPTQIAQWLRDSSGLDFDQVIDEGTETARWCHIGTTRPGYEGPRREALLYRDGKYSALG